MISHLQYFYSANGFLIANIRDFCEQNQTSSAAYDLNVGDIINTIQEDSFNPGSILAVVISNSKTSSPNSQLLRLHSTGNRELIAGTSIHNFRVKHSFLWISSFLQLNRTTILIADSQMRCIRSVNTISKDVHKYSGDCSHHHNFESLKSTSDLEDGPVDRATYSQPNDLYQPSSIQRKILVSDNDRVREIDFVRQYTKTKIVFSQKIQGLIQKGDSYLAAFVNCINIYDQRWSFREQLLKGWIARLDLSPDFNLPTTRPHIYSDRGTGMIYRKAGIQCFNFQMVDLGADLLMLYLTVDPGCRTCYRTFASGDARAVAVYSITQKSLVFMLYNGPIEYEDILSIYPKTAAVSIDNNMIYFSTDDAKSGPTYCSLLKKLDVTGRL